MKEYELYIFDFDGTLFDTINPLVDVYRCAFEAVGISVHEEECKEFVKHSLEHVIKIKDVKKDKVPLFISTLKQAIRSKEVQSKSYPYKDTLNCLKLLKEKNKKMAIVTGNYKLNVEEIMKMHDIDLTFFECIVDVESISKPKPSGDGLLVCLNKLGFLDKKEKCVYIGDALQDKLAALDAEIDYVIVNRSGALFEDEILSLTDIF